MPANEALLLIGHGSARYPNAASAMRRHAESLLASGAFAQVAIAVLNGKPSVGDALAGIDAAVVRVVPFFMEDGYFNRVAVPRAIDMAPRVVGQVVIVGPPIGIHDGMAGVIERQALAGCAELGVASHIAAVVVAGHGSASTPGKVLALHRHAARVASTTLFARVEATCLEEPPFVADTLHGLRAHPTVIIGFFANRGGHVRDDLPVLVAREQGGRGPSGLAVRFHGLVVDDAAVTSIVLDQAGGG